MSKTAPRTTSRSTVINRHSGMGTMPGPGYGSIQRQSVRMSYGAPVFSAGTISDISHTGVNQIVDTRAREKQDMQGLNERFASYIEKVRFLEAQNKALLIECERLKKMKGFDPSEIKRLYEQEIQQCREVINDLTQQKADFDATLAGLEDKLEYEKNERIAAEKNNEQLRGNIDSLTAQIGDYEGELQSLRGRVDNLEDENKRLKEKIARQEDVINGLRADLDEETQKRIIAEQQHQTVFEKAQFDNDVFTAEIEELKKLLNRDKTVEIRDVWRNELRKCVAEMQEEYDKKLNLMKSEYESRVDNQMRQLQAGVQRDNMETLQSKEESKKLKSQLGGLKPRIAELEAENKKLRDQLILLEQEYNDCRDGLEADNAKLQMQLNDYRIQLESVMAELQTLQDAKLSLELEISCYRKLLEGEEHKLSTLVQEASGARSKGADALADMIQQQSSGGGFSAGGSMSSGGGFSAGGSMSSGGGFSAGGSMSGGGGYSEGSMSSIGGGYGTGGSTRGGGGGDQYSMNESQGKMTVQKSCRGPISLSECAFDGTFIQLENTKQKPLGLNGWQIVRDGKAKGSRKTYDFGNVTLQPGQSIRVFGTVAGGDEHHRWVEGDLVANFKTWGSGGCEVKLLDPERNEKASLNLRFNM